ncbi:hypothetical protein D3C87_1886490 [compost metagenome]
MDEPGTKAEAAFHVAARGRGEVRNGNMVICYLDAIFISYHGYFPYRQQFRGRQPAVVTCVTRTPPTRLFSPTEASTGA